MLLLVSQIKMEQPFPQRRLEWQEGDVRTMNHGLEKPVVGGAAEPL